MKSHTRITFSDEACDLFEQHVGMLVGFTVRAKPRGGAPSFMAKVEDRVVKSETGDEVLLQRLNRKLNPLGDPVVMRVQALHVL